MKKETVLEIEFIPVWDKWAWRIKKINTDKKNIDIKLTNETGIKVFTNGDVWADIKTGENSDFLKTISSRQLISTFDKKEIEKLIEAINEKYGKPKRWRAEYGEEYFCINSLGHIVFDAEDRQSEDDKRYSIGNYFQTKEQAKKALERVKKALREVEE